MWSKQGADLPRNWWRIRARVLRRSDICYVCGLPGADEVDHVIPRSEWNRSSSLSLRSEADSLLPVGALTSCTLSKRSVRAPCLPSVVAGLSAR